MTSAQTTRPAPSHPQSAVRIRQAPKLVLLAVEQLGLSFPEAIEFHSARAAESARLSAFARAL
jgi:hypothetical protein